MDMVEMHTSKATNSWWKGFIIKSYDKQWNNDMESHAVWATSIWEQNDPLWSRCSMDCPACRTTNSKVQGATVLPGGACSPESHLLFLPISGAQQRLLHTANHTYAKYCWTPKSRERHSVKRDRRKQWDMLYLVNNHCYNLVCNTGLFPYSTELCKMKAATDSCRLQQEGPHCTSETPCNLQVI